VSAYLIFTPDKTLDEHELATYSKEDSATRAGRAVKPLAFYGAHEDLEGAATEASFRFADPIHELVLVPANAGRFDHSR
jgi:hypothetical protein